ncbi:hypothetical protein TELCIR_23872, partial [Teladorsagia circumcincta]
MDGLVGNVENPHANMQCDQLKREPELLGPAGAGPPKSPNDKVDAKPEAADKAKTAEAPVPVVGKGALKPGEGVLAVPYNDDSSSSERKKKKKKVFVRENKREISRDDGK